MERDDLAAELFVAYLTNDHLSDGQSAAERAYRLADSFLAEKARQQPVKAVPPAAHQAPAHQGKK